MCRRASNNVIDVRTYVRTYVGGHTSVRLEETAFDAVLVLTAVGKQTELGDWRERLRPVVAVLGDDVATLTESAETRDLLLLLQQHHTDRCPNDNYRTTSVICYTNKTRVVPKTEYTRRHGAVSNVMLAASNRSRARGAYSPRLNRGQHATQPAYICVRLLRGQTY